jgi:hypothetical protein
MESETVVVKWLGGTGTLMTHNHVPGSPHLTTHEELLSAGYVKRDDCKYGPGYVKCMERIIEEVREELGASQLDNTVDLVKRLKEENQKLKAENQRLTSENGAVFGVTFSEWERVLNRLRIETKLSSPEAALIQLMDRISILENKLAGWTRLERLCRSLFAIAHD